MTTQDTLSALARRIFNAAHGSPSDQAIPHAFTKEVCAIDTALAPLVAALESTAHMLAYEAQSHEESGCPKRRTFVKSIREQVAIARQALAQAKGGTPQ